MVTGEDIVSGAVLADPRRGREKPMRLGSVIVIGGQTAIDGGLTASPPVEHPTRDEPARKEGAMIGGVSKVVIDVEDQDRAKAFWTETMRFELAQDAPYGEERWLEVRAPDGAVNLILRLRPEGAAPPRAPENLERDVPLR
jgi:hypothetical protein